MKKITKETLLILIGVFLLLCLYTFYHVIDISNYNIGIFKYEGVGIITIIIIIVLVYYFVHYFKGIKQLNNNRYKEKLFNQLMEKSDTIYLMYSYNFNKVIYMTKNVNQILGNSDKEDEKYEIEKIKDLFNTEIIKTELKNWDKKSEFTSQMIAYNNLSYQHDRWLKIKIIPFQEKKELLYIVLITDATNDHNHQHMIVSQATDIKAREKKLNQITASSYDTEIDIDLTTGLCTYLDLKNNDNFNKLKKEKYSDFLNNKFLSKIEEEDYLAIKEKLSIDNLINHDNTPLVLRYKLNNQNEKIWLESTVFFTESKGIKQASILTKNVTEDAESIRKQNLLLKNALEDAKNANEAKSNFLATISHEIRTPMNAIMGLSSTILEEDLSENVKEDVENINSASNNILEIIDNLLDIKTVEKGKYKLKEKEYALAKLFKDIYNINKENNNNITINMNVNKNLPSILYGDSSKIRQLINNLINNSSKIIDNGYINVIADCERVNSKVKLSIIIEDNGIGYTQEEISNILSDDNNLNISISKKLVDFLKGSMEIESKPGLGTKVTIKVEQKIINDKPIGDINDYKEEQQKVIDIDAKDKNILIVDDNKINLKVATKLLQSINANIDTVLSGKECLEKVKAKKYDLIFLDQMMPEMDGIMTLKKLKEIKDFKTPVIVLTADAIKGMKEKYIKEGFNDYISKPIEKEQLYEIIKKYI